MARKRSNDKEGQGNIHPQFEPKKNQGYQLPLRLWQALHEEAGRRKRYGLPLATQNAIACEALDVWLSQHKGRDQ